MDESDAQLVSAYQSGKAEAFEALYFRHAPRVWRFARYFSGSDDAAAEIVQETFVRVARHLSTFEGRAQFSTWLFAIVRSIAIDATTRRRRQPQTGQAEEWMERIPANTPTPDESLAASETRAAVRAAIGRLPENEREAVLLCEIEDLPLKEAAEILGWGESRIKVTLFRARRKLKEMLSTHVELKSS
jgi:RNA polymerase sigma-70 factor (ECF subfamily)